MDARIGTLNSGKFYAFANGYDAPEVVGTLAEVEIALGLIPSQPVERIAAPAPIGARYVVTLRFQFPAWDETNGMPYEVDARSKSEAIRMVRTLAFKDGHVGRGKGRYWFTAEKE